VLVREHEEIRFQLRRAATQPGPIGEAAGRLADMFSAHLDFEERDVFPAFPILRRLMLGQWDEAASEQAVAQIAPLIVGFSQQHPALIRQHEAILAATERLWEAAYEDGNGEIICVARNLTRHESMEDELLYRPLLLIGQCLQGRVSLHGDLGANAAYAHEDVRCASIAKRL